MRKNLIGLFLTVTLIFALVHTVSAQRNETMGTPQNTTFLESPQKSDTDITIEAQRNIDRSLSILNIVATLMGVLVGLITIIVVIAIAIGIFEYSRWVAIREDIEKKAKHMEEMINNVEKDANTIHSKAIGESLSSKLEPQTDPSQNLPELSKVPEPPEELETEKEEVHE